METIKRLRFKYYSKVFESRKAAYEWFDKIIKPTETNPNAPIGNSLMGEPFVFTYDEGGKRNLVLAIGNVDSLNHNPKFELIDISYLRDDLNGLSGMTSEEINILKNDIAKINGDIEVINETLDEHTTQIEDIINLIKEINEGIIKEIYLNNTPFEIENNIASLEIDGEDIKTGAIGELIVDDDGKISLDSGFSIAKNINILDYKINKETTRAEKAESGLTVSINTEYTRATAAEKVLGDRITEETTRAKEAESGLTTSIKAEETRAINAESALTTAIQMEKERAEKEENNLNTEINKLKTKDEEFGIALQTEIDRAKEAESGLTTSIKAEETRAMTAETEITNNLNTLSGNVTSKFSLLDKEDAKLASDLSDEIVRATAAEKALESDLNSEINKLKTKDEEFGIALQTEIDRAKEAESGLTTSIKAEETRATMAEGDLDEKIDDETTRAKEAESGLTTSIKAEETRATTAESVLDKKIEGEISRAKEIESGLTVSINTEHTRATAAEKVLGDRITEETTRAKEAESGLTTSIKAEETRATRAETEITNSLNILSGNVTSKFSLLDKEDAKLASGLSDEIVRATAAEKALESDLNSEISRAENAETAISGEVNTIKSNLETSISKITVKQGINSPITVTPEIDGTKIGLTIESNRILSISDNSLRTTISINYDSESEKLQLLGLDGTVISSTDVKDFLVDGMLANVQVTEQNGQKYIVFTWNTDGGNKEVKINLNEIFVPYTAGNGINISAENTLSVKKNDNSSDAKFITVDGMGVGLVGITDAITNAVNPVLEKVNNEIDRSKGEDTKLENKISSLETEFNKEVARSTGKDSELEGKINGEISRSTGKDTATDTELSNLRNADTRIEGKFDNEIASLKQKDSDFTTELKSISDWQKTFYDKYFITKTATGVSPEDAKDQSLLFKITTSEGVAEIYASNNAKDMIYEGENLKDKLDYILSQIQSINQKITDLENRIENLENTSVTPTDLTGANEEIKITNANGKIQIGFADNAIFGPRI